MDTSSKDGSLDSVTSEDKGTYQREEEEGISPRIGLRERILPD